MGRDSETGRERVRGEREREREVAREREGRGGGGDREVNGSSFVQYFICQHGRCIR